MRTPRHPGWSLAIVAPLAVVFACPGSRSAAAESSLAVERAAALRGEGKLDEALDVLRTESRDIKRLAGEDSLRLLPVNDLAAEILIDQGSLEPAEALLTKVIATRQQLIDAGRQSYEAELAGSLLTLVRLQVQAKRHREAAATAQRALLIRDRTAGPASSEADTVRTTLETVLDAAAEFVGPSDPSVLDARAEAADTFESLGTFTAALDQRRKILDGLDHRDGDADRFAAAERLCRLMMLTGRAEAAIPIAQAAVQRTADSSAPDASPRRLLGELQLADGQFINADASFEAAIDAVRGVKGLPPLASSIDRLRRLLIDVRLGRVTALPDWFGPELKMLAATPPADRDTAAAALAVAADVLAAVGQPAAAAEQLAKSVSLAASVKVPSAGAIADASGRLAAAHLAAGKPSAAVDVARGALAEAEPKLGPGDARVAFLRTMLADALQRQDDSKAAVELFGAALDRELPRPNDAWEELMIGIADRLAAAAPDAKLRERFVAARTEQYGKDHRHTGMAWSMFGAARLAAGDPATAIEWLGRSLAALRHGLGDDHPEVAAAQTLLASAELAAGLRKQAAATASTALQAWERIAGSGHPGTLAAADVLVKARMQAGQSDDVEAILERLSAAGPAFTPIQHADHLVLLASLVVSRDDSRARACVEEAMSLSCWLPAAVVRPRDRAPGAVVAARAAHVLKQLDEPEQAQEAVRRARSWASQADDSSRLLETVESIADSGDAPPVR